MKSVLGNKYFLLGLALLAGVVIGWLLRPDSSVETKEVHNHVEAAEQIWTCAMHPQIRKTEPGDCPICGMELIPLGNLENTDSLDVHMSPTAMQLAGVQTAIVGKSAAEKKIDLNGKVQEDERLIFSQVSHLAGRIEKMLINFTGEYVKKGQIIAYVYSPELVTAQQELFEARKIKDVQPALYQSAIDKLRNWKLHEHMIQKIIKSDQVQDNFPVAAEVSGYVIKKNKQTGEHLSKGEAIYEIADLSKVWLLFDVYESDLVWLNVGDEVSFTVQSLPGKKFNGKITFIDPVIDPKTRVAKARVEVPNREGLLKPEMFARGTVDATLPTSEEALVIPKTAVLWTGTRSVVYVKSATSKGMDFSMREVVLGPALGEGFVVESGLQNGEEIAISGTFSIDAAAQLAGKPSMMNQSKASKSLTAGKPGRISEAKEIQPLFEVYFSLKNALVKDDFKTSALYVNEMFQALKKVDMEVFEGDSHMKWMKYKNELEVALQSAKGAQDLNGIRKSFVNISNTIVALAQNYKPVENILYIQECPMANDNQGASWLSQDADVMNPYFGESMLNCGEVKETIGKSGNK